MKEGHDLVRMGEKSFVVSKRIDKGECFMAGKKGRGKLEERPGKKMGEGFCGRKDRPVEKQHLWKRGNQKGGQVQISTFVSRESGGGPRLVLP